MTAPNKNEGLIRQLLMVRSSGARKGKHWNPDGPEAARAIQDLEEKLAATLEALEPFSTFAENVNDDGWASNIHKERISYWFGPTDFRKARLASTADG